jgi:hypothetical protein
MSKPAPTFEEWLKESNKELFDQLKRRKSRIMKILIIETCVQMAGDGMS